MAASIVSLRVLLGPTQAACLLACFGGETIHFPKRADHQGFQAVSGSLRRIIGPESAERLRHEFAGRTVRLPFSDTDVDGAAVRDALIRAMLQQGDSVAQICRSAIYTARPSVADVRRVAQTLDGERVAA